MKALYCDVCRKEIEQPIADKNYYHVREYDICEPCKETIDAKLKPIVKSHNPYSTEWYQNQLFSLIKKGVANKKA